MFHCQPGASCNCNECEGHVKRRELCFTASTVPLVTALRKPLEADFEHFWNLLAKWLSGGFWKLIVSISRARWPNGSQEASGDSS